jgi:hypothetical protein
MKLLISITLAAFYGISIRMLFASFGDILSVMSISFFFIVPFLIGFLTIAPLPYRNSQNEAGAFFKPWLSCLVILVITWYLKIEGIICWVMAFPIFASFAGLGGLIAFRRKRRRAQRKIQWDFDKDDWEKPGAMKVSLLFFIPIFAGLLEGDQLSGSEDLTVENEIEIQASPSAVWSALTASRQNAIKASHPGLPAIMGFPYHLNTTLDSVAIGGQRIATYEKGLTFVETISQLEPGRRLVVDITTDASKISKAIMDEHIVIGGKHIRMQGDEYNLQALPNGDTKLSLASHFSINTPFNWYARPWSKWLMSDVLLQELQSLSSAASPKTHS